jgi:MFS family permease
MNPWCGIGKLPKEIWVLCGTNLINRMGTMGLPFLIIYLTKSLGFSVADAALILTVYGASALIASPFMGRLSDSIGPLRIMKLSLFFSGIVLVLYPFAKSYFAIIAMTILWSIISEAFRPASLAIITEVVEPEWRRAAFSVNRFAVNLGMSVGPAIGGFLILYSFPLIFWVDGATTLIASFVLIFSLKTEVKHSHMTDLPLETKKGIYKDKQLLIFIVLLFPVFITFFQHASTLPYVCINDLQLQASVYGLFFTVNTILIILIEIPLNLAMSHWSNRRSLALGSLLTGIGFGAMMFAFNFWSVAATVVIWTFGEMIFLPSASAYVAEIAPPACRGTYMGIFQMIGNAAFAFSAWFGMKVLETAGASILWGSVFFACSICAVLFLRIRECRLKT